MHTGVFGKRDIGLVEREFLAVLDFQLGVTEADVLALRSLASFRIRPRVNRAYVLVPRPSPRPSFSHGQPRRSRRIRARRLVH